MDSDKPFCSSQELAAIMGKWADWKVQYPGQWLAVNSPGEPKVICSGNDPRKVRDDAQNKAQPGTVPILIKMPAKGEDDSMAL